MGDNYTIHNQNSIIEYASIDAIEEAVDYLKNPESFRSFREGLVELLRRKGYFGDLSNVAEMSGYLTKKLEKIGSSITKQTVKNWFSGKTTPRVKSDSRPRMYEICFSLELTYQDVIWFFQHVYYDRAFNCHIIEEAVFYYAFLNAIPYSEANRIIGEIKTAPMVATDNSKKSNYTIFVQRRISGFHTEDELKEFLVANKGNFKRWNASALETIKELVSILSNPPKIEERIKKLRRQLQRKIKSGDSVQNLHLVDGEIYQSCGLLMKEIFYDAEYPDEKYGNVGMTSAEFIVERINRRGINSRDFLLDDLLTTFSGVQDGLEIPLIVKKNFPNKKVLSDILAEDKISTSKSYDGIRKMIILLDFYHFWLSVKLKIGYTDLTKEALAETYCGEADYRLQKCGYEGLYQGNPYDWIFLNSAYSEAPLVYLRSYFAELDSEDSI